MNEHLTEPPDVGCEHYIDGECHEAAAMIGQLGSDPCPFHGDLSACEQDRAVSAAEHDWEVRTGR
jgi:hypothetical protein